MATFRLQPCKLRDGWFVPKKATAAIEVDWNGLRTRVAPSATPRAQSVLRNIAAQAYVGTLKQPNGTVTNFVIRNADLSGDIRGVLKRDPLFAHRLVDVYRVDSVVWDDKTIETGR